VFGTGSNGGRKSRMFPSFHHGRSGVGEILMNA